MSNLKKLIRSTKEEVSFIASTVRIPKNLNDFIEELAEQLFLSKQEMMLKLIEEGCNIAREEFNDNSEDFNKMAMEKNRYYLLNTNLQWCIEDHERMLKEGIASAFSDPWKFKIDSLKKGDVVFLYANRTGIVSCGKASGITLEIIRRTDGDDGYYQKLDNFTILSKPLSASEIKKILGYSHPFLMTMSAISDGQKICDEIAIREPSHKCC